MFLFIQSYQISDHNDYVSLFVNLSFSTEIEMSQRKAEMFKKLVLDKMYINRIASVYTLFYISLISNVEITT